MHVKLLAELRFRFATSLTGVVVTSAGIAALCGPVGAIVRKTAALPVAILLTRDRRWGSILAGFATVKATFSMNLADHILAPALLARFGYLSSSGRACFGNFGARNAFMGLAKIDTETTLRAKVQHGLLDLIFIAAKDLAAFIACYVKTFTLLIEVAAAIDHRRAGMGAELPGQTVMIPEMLATSRTVCPDMRGSDLAFTGTPAASLPESRRVIFHSLAALFAGRLHSGHYGFP